ncbi:MAG: hypothetical protein AAFP19_23905 [Bacteroidota bacterium]
MPLRTDFPEAGSNYMDGESDGWEYRTSFGGTTLEQSYAMLRQFLVEEGYANIPVPGDAKELLLFKHPIRNKQILLFENYGYVHNPIKILFPSGRRRKSNILTLCLYNESSPGHLLRFHGVLMD